MELLVEAKYIPDGTVVFKKTGQTPFVLRKEMKIYSYGMKDGNKLLEVVSSDDTDVRYIVDGRGNINMVAGNTILRVPVITDEMGELMEGPLDDIIFAKYGINVYMEWTETPQ